MRRFKLLRFLRISLLSLVGLAVVFTAVVGFAHTKAGRPLLALMGHGAKKGGACPLGFDVAASPEQKEAARLRFAADHRGEGHAAGRPALGFILDETTRDDVVAWAREHHVTCTTPRSGADLDCVNVPDTLLPDAARGAPVRDMRLVFGKRSTLISVVAVRRDSSAAAISSTFRAVTVDLAREAGPPASQEGDAGPARLSAGLLRQASAEYRFTNYYALARATNMGDGFVLTEEYRSLPD